MKRLAIAVSLLASAALAGAPQPETKPADQAGVRAVGVTVALPDPNDPYGQSLVPGVAAGTAVHLALTTKDRFLVSLDESASKLVAFADDKGTDLSKIDRRGWGGRWLGPWVTISPDGHTCRFSIESDKLPGTGAKELRLRARLVLACGADEKTARQSDLPLQKGSTVSVGPAPLEIEQVEERTFAGVYRLTVTFRSDKPLDAIREIAFLGADGKELESALAGSGRMGALGQTVYTRTYELRKKVDKVSLRIAYFDKVQKVAAPVDVTVSVGL